VRGRSGTCGVVSSVPERISCVLDAEVQMHGLVTAKCVLGRSLEGGEHEGEAVGMFELSCECVRLQRGAW
jgi:hypothetical protein